MILEVIACSIEDALAAEHGGATRLEIISRFEVGGLTPAPELVRAITRRTRIPARVMVREAKGFEVADDGERQQLCRLAGRMRDAGANGLVLGFLQGREIDAELLGRVLAEAPDLKATFHRAFEEVAEPFQALETLKKFPQIDCILTSGGRAGSLAEKAAFSNRLAERAAPEIALLVGGGVDLQSIEFLLDSTSIRAFHLGRAARFPATVAGAVCASNVEAFVRKIQWKSEKPSPPREGV